jgi:hypothetical protein
MHSAGSLRTALTHRFCGKDTMFGGDARRKAVDLRIFSTDAPRVARVSVLQNSFWLGGVSASNRCRVRVISLILRIVPHGAARHDRRQRGLDLTIAAGLKPGPRQIVLVYASGDVFEWPSLTLRDSDSMGCFVLGRVDPVS